MYKKCADFNMVSKECCNDAVDVPNTSDKPPDKLGYSYD